MLLGRCGIWRFESDAGGIDARNAADDGGGAGIREGRTARNDCATGGERGVRAAAASGGGDRVASAQPGMTVLLGAMLGV